MLWLLSCCCWQESNSPFRAKPLSNKASTEAKSKKITKHTVRIANATPTKPKQMKNPHLLITGVSGFLGWNLAHIARENWQVTGLYQTHTVAIDGVDVRQANLAETDALPSLLDQLRPDALIHLAAMSSPNQCEKAPVLSQTINVESTAVLGRWCARNGVPMVFTSSSQVFDGEHAPYTEASPTGPRNRYGEQKREAERRLRQSCPQATICRVPLMFGATPAHATSSLQPVLEALQGAGTMKLFTDEIRSSLGAYSASTGLLQMLTCLGELFILAGDEALSRYDFGLRVAAFYGLDPSPLLPSKQADVPMAAGRPRDLTMLNDKAKAAGFAPISLEAELRFAQTMSDSLKIG